MLRCIGCGGPGGGSFGWYDEAMLPSIDDWALDWDTGWWGTGWGWGWGSFENWTPPADSGHDDDCQGLTSTECYCLQKCRRECRHADLNSNCFENCADNCLLPVS